ncbi:MAG TPA: sigma-70 family RNA polymerase sigma factor [Thermomicrobiaceae bacterium]|nr:sigma-70 family RNA polymerase sigma factor [Thermomicrobiaceae bacterium]
MTERAELTEHAGHGEPAEWADDQLVRAIAERDPDAMVTLYDRYGRLAFALAYRILADGSAAEEVVQDAFLRVWRQAAAFDVRRGTLRSWLMTIVHHRAIDVTRRRASRGGGDVDLEAVSYSLAGPDVWGEVAAGIQRDQVRAAVAALPPEQRLVVELAYFEGLTHVEIADRTGTPLGTVKSRLRLGLKKLQETLGAGEASGTRGIDAVTPP